jgi:Tfp pilus assembly protein PilF
MTLKAQWIFSPGQDTAFVLLTPLAILLSFVAAHRSGSVNGLIAFALALAMAHYLPGMLRAYGDRALFRRFRVRLVVAPLLLITITAWFAYLDLHIVILLTLFWGGWHWMMQVYGFARIYDAKVKSAARTPAWLDQMMCLMWFGMCLFVLNNDLPSYLTRFYQSGGPRLPAEAFVWFTRAWLALTIALTLFYLIHMLLALRDGRAPNPLKLVFLVVTFVYLRYTVSVIERPFMGVVMFEAWHDIQYLAIVWLFNVNRVRQGADAGRFIRFLFRPRAVLALVYVGVCLAFGMLYHASRLFEDQTVARVAVSLVTATALLHYYLDGFIWKIRETETSSALGVRPQSEASGAGLPRRSTRGAFAAVPVWVRHAGLWLLFVIPAALFFVIESKGNVPGRMEVYQNVAKAFPDSANARYQLGRELQEMGRLREARVELDRALELAPDLLPAHIFLGVLLADQGDLAGAKPHFEQALKIDPKNAEVLNDLGIVLDEQGDLSNAKTHLELALAIDPKYALAQNNLGIVLAKLGDLAQARVHQERAVSITPDFADAHYQLGLTISKLGDLTGAVDHLEQALRIDKYHYQAHNRLGEILVTQGKLPEAKAQFEQALQIRPDYVPARQNLAKTGAASR